MFDKCYLNAPGEVARGTVRVTHVVVARSDRKRQLRWLEALALNNSRAEAQLMELEQARQSLAQLAAAEAARSESEQRFPGDGVQLWSERHLL